MNPALPNDTKISFCNAFVALRHHVGTCPKCAEYLMFGDGDLCGDTKRQLAMALCYADTSVQFHAPAVRAEPPFTSIIGKRPARDPKTVVHCLKCGLPSTLSQALLDQSCPQCNGTY